MKKFFKRDKFSLVDFVVVAAVLAAVAYALFNYFGQESVGLDKLDKNDRLALKKNIVVLGVDEREEEHDAGRSDTLFVVMFDSDNKSASLLSIPRDTRVRISGHGWDKINHAYAYGGREKTQQTVEELLGIRINNYVMVNFKGFEGLVDAIGGVDMDIEEDMYYYDDWDGFKIDLQKGRRHLDGRAAIQYVRYRDEEGDIGRIRRQQRFLMAVYDKISSADMLLRIPGLAKQLTSMVKTDLRITEMISLGRAMHSMVKEKGLAMATVPGEPEYVGGVSYWLPDITDLREQMVRMQGAEMTERYKSAAELMEKEYHSAVEKEQETEPEAKHKERSEEDLSKKRADKEPAEKAIKKEAAEKPAEGEHKAAVPVEKSESEARRNNMSVRLINCSGDDGIYAEAASRLRSAGFTVIDGGTGDIASQTTVIAKTNNGAVVNKLAGVPFPHALSIDRDDNTDIAGVVILGKDFK